MEPFLKWAGGKRRLIADISARLPRPAPDRRLIEPFMGGAALFFAWEPQAAILADTNHRLVATYTEIRDRPQEVSEALADMFATYRAAAGQGEPEERLQAAAPAYYSFRSSPPLSGPQLAAWFLFINRGGFNGLYRVNKDGDCNTPQGRGRDGGPVLIGPSPERLLEVSRLLQRADVRWQDFGETIASARAGDVLYLDPPYVPLTDTANFTSYAAEGFTLEHHRQMLAAALAAHERGAHVLLSNSSAPAVWEMLGDAWHVTPLLVRRSISRNTDDRSPVFEILATPIARTTQEAAPVSNLEVLPEQAARISEGYCGCGCYTCTLCDHNWRPKGARWSPPASQAPQRPCPFCDTLNGPSKLPGQSYRTWQDGQIIDLEGKPVPSRRWATDACRARIHRENKRRGRAISRQDRRRLAALAGAQALQAEAARMETEAARLVREATERRMEAGVIISQNQTAIPESTEQA